MKNKFWVILIIIMTILPMGCLEEKSSKDTDKNNNSYPLHKNITVTVFWIGEEGHKLNGYTPNTKSTWDDKWLEHYGGIDDPNNRNGYLPTNFTPSENPFYVALPYNDFDENGNRKPEAFEIIYWAKDKNWGPRESMCKNRWLKLIKGDKVAYAQWEDAGPFIENDGDYIFGNASPKNEKYEIAGIDISPAINDYLELTQYDNIDWQFIDFKNVPDGPWQEIITTSQVYWD